MLLWLSGFEFVSRQKLKQALKANEGWKNQLNSFPTGSDVALVADFILSQEWAKLGYGDDLDFDVMWMPF